ncbi:MAG TPA: hypothetical protein VM534_06615, partial [Thermoanaerobaculia bacterium]|nr:hypothetical protein [Thermoanaerobaculia bacterium]
PAARPDVRAMRKLTAWLALLPAALQADPAVFVARPMVMMVRKADLGRACSTAVKVEACTAFAGQVLTCNCERVGEAWRIEARAQFIPVMYVTGAERVAHEKEHIGDVQAALSGYLARLEAARFESSAACEETATVTSARFTRLMDSFKEDSNERFHPRYRRKHPRDVQLMAIR